MVELVYDYPDMLYWIWREVVERRSIAARVLASMIELKLRNTEGFVWPGTGPLNSRPGAPVDIVAPALGPLAALGYRVGKNGETASRRKIILRQAYQSAVPVVADANYMAEWGEPATCRRLHKMARSIAAFASKAKNHREANYAQAIYDWEADLEWLRTEYYVGRCDFIWPSSES